MALTCPWSGLTISRHGNEGPTVLSCAVCDCFGYHPASAARDITRDQGDQL